jgi:hypothetical protein
MAASAISRPAIVDDTGDGLSGTPHTSAFWTDIFNRIDGLFASTDGITINQAGGDGTILRLESSDVAHGMTTLIPTDAFFGLNKITGTTGGAELRGFTTATKALQLMGHQTSEDATKSTAAVAPVTVQVWTKSGTTVAAPAANTNMVVFQHGGTTRFILDSDGDSHQDVGSSWTNFSTHDDFALLAAVSAGVSRGDDPVKSQFGGFLQAHRHELERLRVVNFNDGDGEDHRPFVNMSKLTMLLVGAAIQNAAKIAALEQTIARLLPPAQELIDG